MTPWISHTFRNAIMLRRSSPLAARMPFLAVQWVPWDSIPLRRIRRMDSGIAPFSVLSKVDSAGVLSALSQSLIYVSASFQCELAGMRPKKGYSASVAGGFGT
jgi:hypothetical protein